MSSNQTTMTNATAFTASFTPKPQYTSSPARSDVAIPCQHTTPTCKAHPLPLPPYSPSSHVPAAYPRRAFISLCGATLGLSAAAHMDRAMASDDKVSASLKSLQQIRTRVDDIDSLITGAKWDSVRTVLATRPVVAVKDACNQLLEASSEDLTGPIVGLREDLVSAVRLLDTSVYANVFIGEDRQILGTKVDYDVPRIYLADLKEALDSLIDIASS